MTARKQARTRAVSIRSIVASSEFACGLEDVRAGRPFNPDNNSWDYERGRAFGFTAPLDMPLRNGRALNPKALKLAEILGRHGQYQRFQWRPWRRPDGCGGRTQQQ